MHPNDLAMMQNFTQSLFYTTYKDAGHSWTIIGVATILNMISVPGMVMNAAIIYITMKYNFLIALTAFYDVLHACAHPFFLFVALSGTNFVRYATAFRFIAVPLVGVSGSVFTMALTGLDRLLQISASRWHDHVSRPVYLGTLVLVSLAICILPVLKYAQVAGRVPDIPTTGYISDIFVLDFRDTYYLFMLGCNIVAILFYIAIWFVVKSKTAPGQQATRENKTNSRLFKSLVALICINIGGYFACVFLRLFLEPLVPMDPIQHWLFECVLGHLLNVGVALNAPVLYCCCAEYRKCFTRELRLIAYYLCSGQYPDQITGPTTSVAPISQLTATTK